MVPVDKRRRLSRDKLDAQAQHDAQHARSAEDIFGDDGTGAGFDNYDEMDFGGDDAPFDAADGQFGGDDDGGGAFASGSPAPAFGRPSDNLGSLNLVASPKKPQKLAISYARR